jgi:hypothetical protein
MGEVRDCVSAPKLSEGTPTTQSLHGPGPAVLLGLTKEGPKLSKKDERYDPY